ncbi:MAG TPA: IS1634 family transposase [Methanocorpusculum sp.]|nr:IS1634 family transposase [Methanocorpusculum sp.]
MGENTESDTGQHDKNYYLVKRGNKTYAYRSTSKYDKNKKGPVAETEYLGLYDEKTKSLIPKKRRITERNPLDLVDLKSRRFGASYLLFKIAEEIGLRDDLFNSLGGDCEKILASSIAQVLTGGPQSSTEDAVEGCIIRELLGIGGTFASPRMSELSANLGTNYGGLETLFEKRLRRAGKMLSYDLTSTSTYSTINGWAEFGYNRDGESNMKQMNIGLVTDKRGVPAMFEIYPGSIPDVATLKRTVDRVAELKGEGSTMVMDRIFGSAANLAFLLDNHVSFVMPGKKNTKVIKTIMSNLSKNNTNSDYMQIYNGVTYTVMEFKIGLLPKDPASSNSSDDSNDLEEYDLILEDDERFALVPETRQIKAYACYNAKKASDELNTLISNLTKIEKKLKETNPYKAVHSLKQIAGPYEKYFDVQIVDDKLRIERKKNAITFSMNRNGMFVMLTNGIDSWEDMMQCYDCRVYVEQAFDALKNELDGNRWRVKTPEVAKGRLVITFIALILWATLAAKLREQKSHDTVRAVLQSLDNIMAIGYQGEWKLTEITKRNRTYLDNLNIPMPELRMRLDDKEYIPQNYIDEWKKEHGA